MSLDLNQTLCRSLADINYSINSFYIKIRVIFFVFSSDLEKMQFYIQKDVYYNYSACAVEKWHLNSAHPLSFTVLNLL